MEINGRLTNISGKALLARFNFLFFMVTHQRTSQLATKQQEDTGIPLNFYHPFLHSPSVKELASVALEWSDFPIRYLFCTGAMLQLLVVVLPHWIIIIIVPVRLCCCCCCWVDAAFLCNQHLQLFLSVPGSMFLVTLWPLFRSSVKDDIYKYHSQPLSAVVLTGSG